MHLNLIFYLVPFASFGKENKVCFHAANEIDGATMAGLTEAMISRLLPTMKLQVQFIEHLQQLKGQAPAAPPRIATNNDQQIISLIAMQE